ncbi:type II secretion system protein GspH [Stutzerimonas nosocomialis]|nr:type II secretion system protein GspH [Stutzerimonas nosocomialis]
MEPVKRRRAAGFSLLELLLVLLIVGLLTGLSVAWLARGETAVPDALGRLAQRAASLAEEARDSGRLLGLGWSNGAPALLRLHPNTGGTGWQAEPLGLGDWPEALQPRPAAEGRPWVVFTPTGVAGAALLDWSWPQGGERWQWAGDGQLRIGPQP